MEVHACTTGREGGVTREGVDLMEMCDLARGIWATHCKVNIISVNVLARIIYSCHCLILRSSDEAYKITEPR